jgi:hypothetical protein
MNEQWKEGQKGRMEGKLKEGRLEEGRLEEGRLEEGSRQVKNVRKEGRTKGRKLYHGQSTERREGRKERTNEGGNEGRKEGRKEGGNEGRKEGRMEGSGRKVQEGREDFQTH